MDLSDYIGFAAGFLTTVALIPQLPMMIWNSVSLALAATILGMKLRYG